MNSIFTELLTVAKKVTEFLEDATIAFDSTTEHKITCPVDKRWFLIGGCTGRDNSSTLDITIRNASDEILLWMEDSAAGTGQTSWPSLVAATKHIIHSRLIIVDAGEYVSWIWGTAQGASATLSYSYLEIDV